MQRGAGLGVQRNTRRPRQGGGGCAGGARRRWEGVGGGAGGDQRPPQAYCAGTGRVYRNPIRRGPGNRGFAGGLGPKIGAGRREMFSGATRWADHRARSSSLVFEAGTPIPVWVGDETGDHPS